MHRVLLSLCILAVADAVNNECSQFDSGALLNGFDSGTMIYNSEYVFTCKPDITDPKKSMGVVVNGLLFEQVTCREDEKDKNKMKWFGDDGTVLGLVTNELTVSPCQEIKEFCAVRNVKGPTVDDQTKKLKCPKAIKYNNRLYSELTCDVENYQWTAHGKNLAPVTVPILVKCANPNVCTVEAVGETESTNEVYTCKPKGVGRDKKIPKAIKHLNHHYKSITCNEGNNGKWMADKKDLGKATDILPMACEEYCDITSGSGKEPAKDWDETKFERTIECKGDFEGLFNGNKRVLSNKAVCGSDQWIDGDAEKIASDIYTPVKLYCADACQPNIPDVSTTYTVEMKVENIPVTSRAYTCAAGSANEKRGVELNDGYIYHKLTCDKTEGWKDERGNQLMDMVNKYPLGAFGNVKLACAPVRCTFTTDCDAVPETVRAEYSCEEVRTSAIDRIACDEKQKLYNVAEHKFYDLELRCRNGLKSNIKEWYTRPDSDITKRHWIGENPNVVCLQNHCTLCGELNTVPLGTKPRHSEGTADLCATTWCPNNLWSVKTDDGRLQQYAAHVECSKNKTYAGKWMIDGETTPIVAGSCLTEVSCTVAAKLNTKCDSAWRKFGCVEITPSDTASVSCPEGKKMFFKKKTGQPFFLPAGEKSELSCLKTEGLWKVTEAEIARGGTVICANENPAELKLPAPATEDGRLTQVQVNAAIIVCGVIAGVVVVAVAVVVVYNEIRRRVYRGNEY